MSTKKGLLRGPKISSRGHTTVTKAAVPFVEALREAPEVSKLIIGPIQSHRAGRPRTKCERIPAGLRIQVRGRAETQVLYAYTKSPEAVIEALTYVEHER